MMALTSELLRNEAYRQGFQDAINFMLKVHENANKYTAMKMKHEADSILKYVEMKGRCE